MRIGLISDTHGLLRPAALAFLAGADHILHAGDIGDPAIIEALTRIAPSSAVRGNNDTGDWATALPLTLRLQFDKVAIWLLHDLAELDIDPRAAGIGVVVSGHSHKPGIAHRDGVIYVNPGSGGRRRFSLPIAVGELVIDGRGVTPHIAELVENRK